MSIRPATVTNQGIQFNTKVYYHPEMLIHLGEKCWIEIAKNEQTAKIYTTKDKPWNGIAKLWSQDKPRKANKNCRRGSTAIPENKTRGRK